ncbi:hypothetical protein COLO4_13950 [Corchorus olitorius]|uniref:BRCT domain-containing protein n=1 Tax=Corchorus olitorius TaxID=93759 RepID=A0A1R3JUA0_9ROSI|nr:hypothetical protein COLO4_13950 [Corchorus olitorius]
MGSLGDDKGEINHFEKNSSADAETQPLDFDSEFSFSVFGESKFSEKNPNTDAETQPLDFDSQFFFPVLSSGDIADKEDGDGLEYLQSTVPLDDHDVGVDDELETQAVNFDGETQVLNLGGETQVLDDFMETQLLDEFDDEVVLDSDGEGTDQTEVLNDTDEGDCAQSTREEEKKESLEQCNASADEQKSSGIHAPTTTKDVEALPELKPRSVRRFTTVRAASLRASGLAARNAALREINSNSCSIRTDSEFSDQFTVNSSGLNSEVAEKINQAHDRGNYDEKSIGCRVDSSTARKLFSDDSLGENQGISCSNENADGREDLLQSPDYDGPSAGLSYVDSQEPGELSQANALNFVERFVNENLVELDGEIPLRKSTREESKLISSAKGPQSLAKKTIERSTANETGIFEWDDLLEDEGGGDIYCRRKEEFYGSGIRARKSATHPQKRKVRKLDASYNEDQPNAHYKKIFHSDSKLLLGKSKDNGKTVQGSEMNFRKNLFNEFDEQFNPESSGGQLEATAAQTGIPEVVNVGLDTQMAAEAMEALFYGEGATDQNANQGVQSISKDSSKGSLKGKSRKKVFSEEPTLRRVVHFSDAAPVTRGSKKTKSSTESSLLQDRRSKNVRRECDTELHLSKLKKAKSRTDKHQVAGGIDMYKTPPKSNQRKAGGTLERSQLHGTRKSARGMKKQHPEEVHSSIPVAHRTRRSLLMNMQTAETPASDCGEGRKHKKDIGFHEKSRSTSTEVMLSAVSNAKGKLPKLGSKQSGENDNVKSSNNDQLHLELIAESNVNHVLSYPKQRRSCRRMSTDVGESDKGEAQPRVSVEEENDGQSVAVLKRSRSSSRNSHKHLNIKRIKRSSENTCPVMYSADQNSEGELSHQSSDKSRSGVDVLEHSEGNCDAVPLPVAESSAVNATLDKSPKEKSKSPGSVCNTPVNCPTPINDASPICMGEEYFKQSCKKNLSRTSLIKELRSLSPIEHEPISPLKDLRKRRDLANVRVLFSNHLDEDIVKQQKKILVRLGISEVSSILDATHFITDKFVRTRNMLEAIASGKPIVTHLWLESIGQVNIHIDEEAYILRDIKKEKELGFCMPVSLARARKRPLLQGRRVLVTPNTKPGKDTISHLVTAVGGQAVERIGRSATKDDKVPDDLLVLSCEEDYAICVSFLEKGAAVYSSELLLNGIVTQKLEYERHRLFADNVKRTRSTLWLRKDNKFHPITKPK